MKLNIRFLNRTNPEAEEICQTLDLPENCTMGQAETLAKSSVLFANEIKTGVLLGKSSTIKYIPIIFDFILFI